MKRTIALALLVGAALPWAGCTQQTTTVPVRSLERSGRASFVCLRTNAAVAPGAQLESCFNMATPPAVTDYSTGPHVIGLVTQTTRGEVAVVDVSSQAVLDADNTIPGYNFLPIGAVPTDIVSTPGGNATFVASADPLRPGIYGIPSVRLPGQLEAAKPTLASWPACSLRDVPSSLVIVADSTGAHPGRCDASTPATVPAPDVDLSSETAVFGRLKIVATLPDVGEIVVIDAQELLARPPGSFDPCPIESTAITLQSVPPGAPDLDAGAGVATADVSASDGGASTSDGSSQGAGSDGGPVDLATCSGRVMASPPPSLAPHPVDMALADDGRLFVSDDSASVVHVMDVSDPCHVAERDPLLPYSAADPTRAVVTSSIAVSPLTTDQKRYVYAVDAKGNGSVMVFDVSSDSTTRRPILRPNPQYNLFEPPDRLVFSSPVTSLAFATRELPQPSTTTGVVPRGVKCDPAVAVSDTTNPAYNYRPVDFTSGAGPRVLRGTFAFVSLTSGRLAVVDLDDFDAPCRRPATSDDPSLACPGAQMLSATMTLPSASSEASCTVVERHRARSLQYFANATNAGLHAPAMQTPPLFFDNTGTVQSTEPLTRPRLLGPSLAGKTTDTNMLLATVTSGSGVADNPMNPSDHDLSSNPALSVRNWVAFDLREPRAHADQIWTIVYEGMLPPFRGRRGRFQCAADKTAIECEGGANPSNYVLYDSSVGFCDNGAQGSAIATSMNLPSGDIVQVVEPLPDPADPYWGTVGGVCSYASCEQVYGTPDAPASGRDLPIDTSYQDRLVLEPSSSRARAPLACCFPYPAGYTVRAGKHWLVTGTASGYQHHIIPDPTAADPSTARCIASCDPALALRNSRAADLPQKTIDPVTKMEVVTATPAYDGAGAFRNAQMQFVIWQPAATCSSGPCVTLDMYFSFTETGGFQPTEIGLSTLAIMPQSIIFVPGINQLALPDAISQGLMMFDFATLSSNGVRVFN
jgi:hypothetical protein